jgi:site-specific DNA-adenine methylase
MESRYKVGTKLGRETTSTSVPAFAYPGGKAKLAKHIIRQLPAGGERFVEVFAGRANVFFHVAQLLNYRSFWLNDISTYPFLLSLCAYGAIDALGHGTVPPRNGRATHDAMAKFTTEAFLDNRAHHNPAHKKLLKQVWNLRPDLHKWATETPASRAVLLESFLVRSGNRYGKAGVRGEIGGGVSRATYERNLRIATEIMMRTEPRITCVDYREVLKECGLGDVLFLDPPYKNYGRKTGAYSESLNHEEMVQILMDAPFRWVLSEYEHEIYNPLTQKFGEPVRIVVRKTMSDSNHHGGRRPKAVECIWRNF